ncbi:MAG TPA: PadR family transcriptional regulator [Gemmatimonadaceae bacterium]|jgi:PadR family transcriptional regulator PadR|nr:PadR family transcriptional regulator [Gemmatimonadaceae bacterium]
MPREKGELVPGTLEMLTLKTLSLGSLHGYGIAQHIQRLSHDVLHVEEGSLYPALQRMLAKGWVTAEWRETPTKRRARYYRLTPAGRKQLALEHTSFAQTMRAITRVMDATEAR